MPKKKCYWSPTENVSSNNLNETSQTPRNKRKRGDYYEKKLNIEQRDVIDLAEDEPLKDLSADFVGMLEKSQFSDVTIKCGDEMFKVHKSVLSARSSVFETMFGSTLQETEDSIVVINDIEPATIKLLLVFIYSAQIQDMDIPTAYDLLNAAEKYQVKTLKKICVDFLKVSISPGNAVQILQCGQLYDPELKAYASEYISEDFSSFRRTEAWANLQTNNPVLAIEVYSRVVDKFLK